MTDIFTPAAQMFEVHEELERLRTRGDITEDERKRVSLAAAIIAGIFKERGVEPYMSDDDIEGTDFSNFKRWNQ